MIATKLAKVNLMNDSNAILYFGDLDLNLKFKSQLIDVKILLKMRHFFNLLMDIHQTCIDISS